MYGAVVSGDTGDASATKRERENPASQNPWSASLKKLLLKIKLRLRELMDRRGGPDLIEYALILTLVSLAAAGHVHKVTMTVDTLFTNISNTLCVTTPLNQ
jgi:Flp pilus assembly pilin Flp